MDDICPASTVFASFNAYGSGMSASSAGGVEKEIEVYRFNNHEGGQEHHWSRQLVFLRKILG
jgi:cephalosporin-C deacetylase